MPEELTAMEWYKRSVRTAKTNPLCECTHGCLNHWFSGPGTDWDFTYRNCFLCKCPKYTPITNN